MSKTRKCHYLNPADFYFTRDSVVIKTLLGSCLSITMFSRKAGAAAVCHALLPSCRKKSCALRTCTGKYRFVECVIPEMLERFRRLGTGPDDIEIKMFGGADMIMVRKNSRAGENERIGRMNIAAARKVLRNNRLQLKEVDVGGTLGRQILFDTETGNVRMKRLNRP